LRFRRITRNRAHSSGGAQVFLSSQHFALKRQLLRTSLYRKQLAARFDAWRLFTGVTRNPSTVF
jgi:putative transposase